MPIVIDLVKARELLGELVDTAESDDTESNLGPDVERAIEIILSSATGAFRQALVGTVLIKLLGKDADLSLPSTEHGARSYSGRTVDEAVVMPLFGARRIPVSQSSAYLSTLRRGKRFVDEDVRGIRDRATYLATNQFVNWLQHANGPEAREAGLRLIAGFLRLRDARQIELIYLLRISQAQLESMIANMLSRPSGGRWPMLIVEAVLAAVNHVFVCGWTIESQGINSSDASRGSVGDITVIDSDRIILGVEVTERAVDALRIRTAMTEKAMPKQVTDYLYLVTTAPTAEAQAIAKACFGQGYDVSFLNVADWAANTLGLSALLKATFVQKLRAALGRPDTPSQLKVAWNEIAANLV